MDSPISKDLVFLLHQFLGEEKYTQSVRVLEKESGLYFNMKYFEMIVRRGDWDEIEKYLSAFTKVDDNRHSTKIFFEIRKQKYLEAVDRKDFGKAVEILRNDLKVFAAGHEDLYKELTMLLTLDNIREHEELRIYGDTKSAREVMLRALIEFIESNPMFHEKLEYPTIMKSRLKRLIYQSFKWQLHLCNNPEPNPDGGVVILEPNESEGQWGSAPTGNGGDRGSSNPTMAEAPMSDKQP